MPIITSLDLFSWANQYTGRLDCSNLSQTNELDENLLLLASQLSKSERDKIPTWTPPEYHTHYINLWDDSYPDTISRMPYAPPILFFRGDIGLLNHSTLAIVGTRNPHSRSIQLTRTLSRSIETNSIIGGCSPGIEYEALNSILSNQTKTKVIAVLEKPIHMFSGYRKIWIDTIIDQGGLVVSEFGPTYTYKKWYFAQRNRLLAALSDSIILIEASTSSGSLSIAQYGLELGRKTFAIPHHADDVFGAGCNQMILEGAQPLFDKSLLFPDSNNQDLEYLNTPRTIQEIASIRKESMVETFDWLMQMKNNGTLFKTGHLWKRW